MSHRERFKSHDLTRWDGDTMPSVASQMPDCDWICIEVRCGIGYESLAFRRMQPGSEIEKVRRMLDDAYEAGYRAAQSDIRKALGVKEPRL